MTANQKLSYPFKVIAKSLNTRPDFGSPAEKLIAKPVFYLLLQSTEAKLEVEVSAAFYRTISLR